MRTSDCLPIQLSHIVLTSSFRTLWSIQVGRGVLSFKLYPRWTTCPQTTRLALSRETTSPAYTSSSNTLARVADLIYVGALRKTRLSLRVTCLARSNLSVSVLANFFMIFPAAAISNSGAVYQTRMTNGNSCRSSSLLVAFAYISSRILCLYRHVTRWRFDAPGLKIDLSLTCIIYFNFWYTYNYSLLTISIL